MNFKLLFSFFVALVLFNTSPLLSADITWIGGNGHWSNPSNWDLDRIPERQDRVFVPEGEIRHATGTATQIEFLKLERGAYIMIETGSNMVLSGYNSLAAIENHGTMDVQGELLIYRIYGGASGLINYGQFEVKQGGDLTIESVDHAGIINEGDIYNLGSFTISGTGDNCITNQGKLDNSGPMLLLGSENAWNNAIRNSGTILNRTLGYIEVPQGYYGISNSSLANHFKNWGKINIKNTIWAGLISSSLFTNYAAGTITMNNAAMTVKRDVFVNNGNIIVAGGTGSYNAIYSEGYLENNGSIRAIGNAEGGIRLTYSSGVTLRNNGYILIEDNGPYSIHLNNGVLENGPNGYMEFSKGITGGADMVNEGIVIAKSSYTLLDMHLTNSGIFNDVNNKLVGPITNNGVIVHPIQGPLREGEGTWDILDIGSLSGITLSHIWYTKIFGGDQAGMFYSSINLFITFADGEGEEDVFLMGQIDGTSNSAYLTVNVINPTPLGSEASLFNEVQDDNYLTTPAMESEGINIYPNPASDKLAIKADFTSESKVEVINVQGEVMKKQNIDRETDETSLFIDDIPSGTYVLKIYVGGRVEVRPFVKI